MNNDLISREALLHEIGKLSLDWEYGLGVKDCLDIIDNAPIVNIPNYGGQVVPDVLQGWKYEERDQAEWLEVYTDTCHSFLGYKCSICNTDALDSNDYSYKSNFCPFCGAQMRKDENNG